MTWQSRDVELGAIREDPLVEKFTRDVSIGNSHVAPTIEVCRVLEKSGQVSSRKGTSLGVPARISHKFAGIAWGFPRGFDQKSLGISFWKINKNP